VTITPERTYLARAFDDGKYDWARSRRIRRRAVIAEAVLLTVLFAVTLAAATTEAGSTPGYVVVWTVGWLAFIPVHSVLNLGIRGVFDRSGRSLDEHQLRLRDRSRSATGWPGLALHFAAWSGAVAVVARSGHVMLALCLGFLLWFTGWLLPAWYLAWTSADEPSDVAA
jgi:hypothetical protein